MPFALVKGQAVCDMPQDLYIPPDALEVFLEAFEGPLDLLLYLIKRQNLDILDIPIADITRQYIDYIEMMHQMRLELAADYLLMAAMLAEIKSRMLLPRPVSTSDEEEDPRAELVRRLQEYERYRKAAQQIDSLDRTGRDLMTAGVSIPDGCIEQTAPTVDLTEIVLAFKEVLARTDNFAHHQILMEPLSVRERMNQILDILGQQEVAPFIAFFNPEEGRRAVVVSLLAILEMSKDGIIELTQEGAFSPIYVRAQCR